MQSSSFKTEPSPHSGRQAAMRICALADAEELSGIADRLAGDHEIADLRATERGLVMVRGRIGGEGAPFNLGEASVVRAAVQLPDGIQGFAYHLGRDGRKARAAAILDALWQRPESREQVDRELSAIAERLAAEAAIEARRTAATRVNFFTMTRGED